MNPFEYLLDLLTRLPRTANRQLAELLPAPRDAERNAERQAVA